MSVDNKQMLELQPREGVDFPTGCNFSATKLRKYILGLTWYVAKIKGFLHRGETPPDDKNTVWYKEDNTGCLDAKYVYCFNCKKWLKYDAAQIGEERTFLRLYADTVEEDMKARELHCQWVLLSKDHSFYLDLTDPQLDTTRFEKSDIKDEEFYRYTVVKIGGCGCED